MRFLFFIFMFNVLFPSYYAIGDTITYIHQNESHDVCYGDYPFQELTLSHFNGKISVFGLSTSWWPTECTFSLEALIDSLGNDDRIKIFESLDDPNQPYSCTQWGDLGQDGIPIIIEPSEQYYLHYLFSLQGYFGIIVILDHNMIYRYSGNSIYQAINTIEEILSETSWIEGDFNFDESVDILDVIFIVNSVLSGNYNFHSDLNQDYLLNIQDVIILINNILEN